MLKFRPRSEREIRQRLELKHYSPAVVAQTTEFLKSKRFIDDADFSRVWAQSRLEKSYGLRRIKAELKLKGVDSGIIEQVCGALALKYPEEETVGGLAREKFRQYKGTEPQKAKQRIFAYLIRRGFSPAIVTDVTEQL